jgi:uncharacterized membrane protein YqhA
MKSLETLVERVICVSRWIMVVFYISHAVALLLYAISFGLKFYKIALQMPGMTDANMILAI